ncbi:MAG: barstar family protein, partial [Anaerolineaceae bacterium]
DALWDILSTTSEPIQVNLFFYKQLEKNLGSYGNELIKVFKDASKVNSKLVFQIMKEFSWMPR